MSELEKWLERWSLDVDGVSCRWCGGFPNAHCDDCPIPIMLSLRAEAAEARLRVLEQAHERLRKVERFEVAGRYGGRTEWRGHPTGTWARWEDIETALASLPAPEVKPHE